MADLLSEIEYGRILGSFTAVAEDFGDTVAPDAIPLTGTVLFTPSVSHVSYVNSAGETASLYVSPVSAAITSGRLVGSDGKDGVTLLASNSNNVSASVLWNASIRINPLGPDQEAPETYNFLIEVRRNEISSLIDVIKANSRVHNVALFHDAIAEAAEKFWERVEAGEFRGNQGPPGPAGVGIGMPGPSGRPGASGEDGEAGLGGNIIPDGDLEDPGFLVQGDYVESTDAYSGDKSVRLSHAVSRKIAIKPDKSYVGGVAVKADESVSVKITLRVFGHEGDIDRVIETTDTTHVGAWRELAFALDTKVGDQSLEIITETDGRTITVDYYTLIDSTVIQGLQTRLSEAKAELDAAMANLAVDLEMVDTERVRLNESLNDLAAVLEDADIDLTLVNEELADLKSDLAAEETKRQEADAAAQLILDQLDTNLAQARTDLDANAEIIGQLDTDLAQSLVDLEASKAKIDTLENITLPGLKATLEEADRQARADLDTLDGLLSGLDTALRENDQTIEELTTTILPGLRASLEENTTALSGMDTTLSQAKTDLAQVSTDLTTEREERIAAVGAAQGTITELDGKLSTAFPDGPFNVPNELAQTIYRSDVQYAVSSSETVAPTTGWSGDSPTREPGEFVWFRTVITYGDGTTATSSAALMTGNTGEAGIPGEKGDPGEDGTSVTIKGTLDSVSDLPASGDAGDSYLVGGYLYIWSGSWENVGLIRGPQGVPGEPGADGKPTYTWVKYADTSEGLGMSDDPAGKRYIGLAFNKTEQTESTNTADYQWTLFEGPEGLPGDKGDQGVGVESITPYYRQEASSDPKPSQPSGMAPAGWSDEEPMWAQNTALWRAERVIYSNNVISWTPVTLVSAHTGIDKAIIDARNASNEAVEAQRAAENALAAATNLIPNGDFEVNGGGEVFQNWTIATPWEIVKDPDDAHQGFSFLRLIHTGDHAPWAYTVAEPQVIAGRTYRFSIAMRITNGTATGANGGMAPLWYDADGGGINRSDEYPYDLWRGFRMLSELTDEWQVFTGDVVAPSDAVKIRPRLYFNDNSFTPGTVVDIDALSLIDVTDALAAEAVAKEAKDRADEAHELAAGKPDMSEVQQAITASANGKNSVVRSTVAPNKDGAVSGDIWYQVVDLDSVGSEIAKWIWDGSKWVQSLINSEMIEYLDVLKVTGQDADFRTFFAEKLTANEAVIDDLWADGIAAKSITASRLTVAPGNIFPDPYFQEESKWSHIGGGVVEGPTPQENVLRIETTTARQRGAYYGDSSGHAVTYSPGTTYKISFEVKATNPEARLYVYLRTNGPSGSSWYSSGVTLSGGDSWTTYEWTYDYPENPPNGHLGTIGLYTVGPYLANHVIDVRNVRVVPMVGAVLIEDGAISADKITSGAITTEKLDALAITAGKIAADAITTDKIAAKAINAGKIAANTITASEINSESVAAEVGKFLKLNVGSLVASDAQVDSAVIDKLWVDGLVGKTATFNRLTIAGQGLAPPMTDASLWELSDGARWMTNSHSRTGYAIQITPDTGGDAYGPVIPVTPGDRYRVTAHMGRIGSTQDTGGRYYIGIRGTDGDGNVTSYGPYAETGNDAGSWGTEVSGEITIPEGVHYARAYFLLQRATGTPHSSGHTTVYDLRIQPMTGAVLIEDGAVNATKINAESVGAAVGEFVKLDVKNLTASSANIDSLVAQRIAAGTAAFQTVNADKIVASTGTMDSATINQIWADGIAAKSATFNRLTIAPGSMWPDPRFEMGNPIGGGWEVIDGGIEKNGTGALSGSYAYDILMPVEYGEEYIISGRVDYLEGSTGTTPMYARSYTADGTYIGGSSVVPVRAYPTHDGTVVSGTWTPYSEDTAYLVLGAYTEPSMPSSVRVRWTGIKVRPKVGAVLIEDGAVSANHISSNSIDTGHLRANAITADKIGANEIVAGKIAANAVDTDQLRANAIDADKIAANAVIAGKIATDAVSADTIQANAITAAKINAGAITAQKIDAGAVTAVKIEAGAVTTAKMTANSINGDRISAGTLNADKLNANTAMIDKLWANGLDAKTGTFGRLTVGNENLAPPILPGSGQWEMSGGGASIYSLPSRSSTDYALRLEPHNGSASIHGPMFDVEPGDEYRFTWRGGRSGSQATAGRWYMGLRSYDESGGIVTYGPYADNGVNGFNWDTEFDQTVTIPSGARKAHVVFLIQRMTDPGANSHTTFYDLRVVKKAGSVHIANGAITADKITSGAIQTGHMTANTIDGDRIRANTLSANKIIGGSFEGKSFTGGTFTGSVIRTAATAPRAYLGPIFYGGSSTPSTEGLMVDGSDGDQIIVEAPRSGGRTRLGMWDTLGRPSLQITGAEPDTGNTYGFRLFNTDGSNSMTIGRSEGLNTSSVVWMYDPLGDSRLTMQGGDSQLSSGLFLYNHMGKITLRLLGGTGSKQAEMEISDGNGSTTTYIRGNGQFRIGNGAIWGDAGSKNAFFGADVQVGHGSFKTFESVYLYNLTSSSSAGHLVLSSGSRVHYSSSSRRYKKNIVDWRPDSSRVLSLRPRQWQHHDRDNPDNPNNFSEEWHVGFISEEVHDLGLKGLVRYAGDGAGGWRPEGLNYERFAAAQQIVLVEHEDKITELRDEIDDLKDLVNRLTRNEDTV